MNCGLRHRRGVDPVLLWHRPAAVAPVGPLAWEPLYATGVALKEPKKKNVNIIFVGQYKMYFWLIWKLNLETMNYQSAIYSHV